ncbi:hypothetical protein FOZ62_015450, partial [Perkinsus olseni]
MIITDDQQWPVEAAESNPFSANNRTPDQPEQGRGFIGDLIARPTRNIFADFKSDASLLDVVR